MPPTDKKPVPIRLTTERFLLRSLELSDATERFAAWLADPEVMKPLNKPTSQLTVQQLQAIIRAVDGISNFQIGIFERRSKTHVGNFYASIDDVHQTATFDVMIGDTGYWGGKVVNECRAALLDHFFRVRGIEKVIGRPLVRNFPSVFNYKAQGWHLEGILKDQWRSFYGEGRLDQYQFCMLKDEWRSRRLTGQAKAKAKKGGRKETSARQRS